jgi:predicted tellurium resistance membrane protein TerC
VPRILLLLALPFVLSLEHPVFYLPAFIDDPEKPGTQQLGISWQNLIVIIGGLFLLAKATHEIHHKLEGVEHPENAGGIGKAGAAMTSILIQIMMLNIVFSLDSIITAIGMVPKEQVMVMVLAVVISTIVMAVSVNAVSAFVERHPTVKMLALAFLLLIGMTLLIEGLHFHIPKGYVYFAMGFSVFVEVLNLRATGKKKTTPVHLREPHAVERPTGSPG